MLSYGRSEDFRIWHHGQRVSGRPRNFEHDKTLTPSVLQTSGMGSCRDDVESPDHTGVETFPHHSIVPADISATDEVPSSLMGVGLIQQQIVIYAQRMFNFTIQSSC
jgi:hypothetical protein